MKTSRDEGRVDVAPTELKLGGRGFYKDVAPTALNAGEALCRNLLVFVRNRENCLRLEMSFFGALLAIFNFPLLLGNWNSEWAFFPAAVLRGEWWRVLTHPFVHLTWYHLLLDGAAFFLLYRDLARFSFLTRMSYLTASGLGSLAIALWSAPDVNQIGLCGLSGVAHGMMAISALELIRRRSRRKAGLFWYGLLMGKCILEASTGKVFFAAVHFGLLGLPVAVCHAGGALGAFALALGTQLAGNVKETQSC